MTTHQFIERKLHATAGRIATNTLVIFLIRTHSIKYVVNTHLAMVRELNR